MRNKPGRKHDYRCSVCGRAQPRDKLASKCVIFHALGKQRTVVRSRVVGWFCQRCMWRDVDYDREPYSQSPGFAADVVEKAPGR